LVAPFIDWPGAARFLFFLEPRARAEDVAAAQMLDVTAAMVADGAPDPAVTWAARLLRDPATRAEDVAAEVGLSLRQLRRRCQAVVGYGPKTLQRVLRFRGFISRVDARPEIMIPLAGTVAELRAVHAELKPVAEAVQKEAGIRVPYKFGTMIEIPRAALTAGEIAEEAEFFSFGTNDLTQTTFGFSRDDVNKVLPTYLAEGILKQDPFAALDQEGVGQLVKMATERGRKTRSNLKVGICGEHGGEPSSVEFCYRTGLNYVSCSPFRVLTARLAAAQAAAAEALKVEGGRTK